MGTYEEEEEQATADNAESNERGTDLGTRINAQAGDVSVRSAHPPVMTNNEADTSLGSMQIVPVDRDWNELWDERGVV